jgi:hypothetical protein
MSELLARVKATVTANRAGLLARILRRPCVVCEQHRWHHDPYVRARPVCYMHKGRRGQWVYR